MKSADQGPQVYGSEMTYLRRYAVLAALALAPEADDDGKAAQDRADQQARQRPARAEMAPKASGRAQEAPGESGDPELMQIQRGADGALLVGKWVAAAKNALADRPESWRRAWLELHGVELEEVRKARREWADRLEALAIAPDPAPMPEAAE